ncbi:unnamed protein product [Clonostachys byssicola]|uniref:Cell wall mannoprotein PIR1-like C-terminal domain-containing protein n=1 Tax=Clonostachys byssicola TaxID=160290 RepID=A0A9N9Y5S4_9HYPO|nr:unnamed protein product [Clonostachys byssicola]
MKWESVLLACLSAAVQAAPPSEPKDVGNTKRISEGCSASYNGKFQIIISKRTAKRSEVQSGKCTDKGALVMSLKDGGLIDSQNRIGSIASNHQFQFDGPAQPNALATKGWAVCDDSTLALGPTRTFYECLSGDFYNLYDRNSAKQCEPVTIYVESCEAPDNADQPRVSQIADGQIQAPTKGAIVTKTRNVKVHVPTVVPPPRPIGSQTEPSRAPPPPSSSPSSPSQTPGPSTPTPTPKLQATSSSSPQQPQKPIEIEENPTPSSPPASRGNKMGSHSFATLIVGVFWIFMYI